MILTLFLIALNADVPMDTSKILKQNEALAIDAKNKRIDFVLELTKDGKIKKRFLSKHEKNALYKSLQESHSNLWQDIDLKVDSAKKSQDSSYEKSAESSINSRSHIKEWDKKKIIYEQVVDRIEILR